jgi:hypothetical protein
MAWAVWIRAVAVAEGMAMAGPGRMDQLDNGRKKVRVRGRVSNGSQTVTYLLRLSLKPNTER